MTTAAASEATAPHEDDANVPHSREGLAFWNVHVPESQRTRVCPPHLAVCDDADRAQLALHDDEYQPLSWAEVKATITSNRLGDFKRRPSDLWRYRVYMEDIKNTHGSVLKFILAHRLHWTDLAPANPVPFADRSDYKILMNDWPYGLDERIKHVVVWVKFSFEEDPATGDLTATSRKQIDDYVRQTFVKGNENGRENVAWFKNWAQLKSVRAVEHFHVMLFDPDPAFLRHVTGGDVEMSKRIKTV